MKFPQSLDGTNHFPSPADTSVFRRLTSETICWITSGRPLSRKEVVKISRCLDYKIKAVQPLEIK